MSEEKFYRYTSNKDPFDGTTRVIADRDESGNEVVLVQGGDPVQLTDEQAENVRRRFNIRAVSDEEAAKAAEKDEESESPAPRRRKGSAGDTGQGSGSAGAVSVEGSSGDTGSDAGAATGASDQGTRGASGQDAGTTTGGTR